MYETARFPCIHGKYRSHYGAGTFDSMKARHATWCKGGEYRTLRLIDPSKVSYLSDDGRVPVRVYIQEGFVGDD